MSTYSQFLERKAQVGGLSGFEPTFMPDFLFDFQRYLLEWSIRKGRGAIYADCGLGKGPMQLVWAQNIVERTNKPVLIFTPLAVSYQMVREAEKFGIEAKRSSDGKINSKIVITNYQRMHYFDKNDFSAVSCDESSILKSETGATRNAITEFIRQMEYRLLCTATAAPNDYFELGTSSEALGELGYSDMITRFFKEDVVKGYLGWGRKTYKFRGHAEEPFWKWVCSWARVCRRPSDLGFDDGKFLLPSLTETELVLKISKCREGMLFPIPANDLREKREERRDTLEERCEAAANIAKDHDGSTVLWCNLNPEGDLLEKTVPDCVQVSGSMSDDEKEEGLLAFQEGKVKRLVTKAKLACFGLNWQHCHNITCFPTDSFEQYYQLLRRCWRFGQKSPVKATIVTSEGDLKTLANLQRKGRQADVMFESIRKHANDVLRIERTNPYTKKEELPSWL